MISDDEEEYDDSAALKILAAQVDTIILRNRFSTPSRESLLDLIRVAKPDINDGDLDNYGDLHGNFEMLKAVLQPTGFSSGAEREHALTRISEMNRFFTEACSNSSIFHSAGTVQHAQEASSEGYGTLPAKKKARRSHGSLPRTDSESYHVVSAQRQLSFHVCEKWPQLSAVPSPKAMPRQSRFLDLTSLSLGIGSNCVNAYNAISTGNMEVQYDYMNKRRPNDPSDIFALLERHGGWKCLRGIDDIMNHIVLKGPVVSTSFILSTNLLECFPPEKRDNFECHLAGSTHPLLIMGWTTGPIGRAWVVRSVRGNADMSIAIGQFGIEDHIVGMVV